jgi:uncharacterized protein with ATP-grasp and redox domains
MRSATGMKTYFECLPCFVNQALGSLRRCDVTEEQVAVAMRSVFSELTGIDFSSSPPVTAQKICRIVRNAVHAVDPYVYEKKRYNEFAAGLLPEIRRSLVTSENVFTDKVKLAIAGNIIDFGKNASLDENDVKDCFKSALDTPIDPAAVKSLQEAMVFSDSILYLCDNAGEIVFDRFLIEEMPLQKITCAVRGMPVINDATIEDARSVGLVDLVRVISNGSDAPGTVLEECSVEFKQVFEHADIVIAKGQGNFETLSGLVNKRIFYLFQVKCPIVARDIGFSVGTFVIRDSFAAPDARGEELPAGGGTGGDVKQP